MDNLIDNLKKIDFTVRKKHLKDDIVELYLRLFVNVSKDDLMVEELDGGSINSIVKVARNNESNAVIFRTFGMKLNTNIDKKKRDTENVSDPPISERTEESVFNRQTETKVMNLLSKHGLCKIALAVYNNGVCYEYSHGVNSNGKIMLTDEFRDEMASKLANLHEIKINLPEINWDTHLDKLQFNSEVLFTESFAKLDHIIEMIDESPYNNFPKISHLQAEEKRILEKLREIGLGEIGLCHNDLNQTNIIWNPNGQSLSKISLIDLELVMDNYEIMDIGYLFVSYCGHFNTDFDVSLFPDKCYRLAFLRRYLEEKTRLNIPNDDSSFDDELNLLFIRSNLSCLYSMLYNMKILPSVDLRKQLFPNAESEEDDQDHEQKVGEKFRNGKMALKIYKLYSQLVNQYVELANVYLSHKNAVE